MAQISRQSQVQAQQQTQTLSPQQILAVKLLELPALELEDRVNAELLENPALEEGREDSDNDTAADSGTDDATEGDEHMDYDARDDYREEDDIPDYKLQEHNRSNEERAEEIPFSAATSFFESLNAQLGEQDLTPEDMELAEYIVGSLDDDGMLRKQIPALVDELAIYSGINTSAEDLERVLKVVQGLDPAGIGARNLKECLLLQIQRKKELGEENSRLLDREERVIANYYDEFTHKHWDKIQQRMGLADDEFQTVIKGLTRLNPRPGASMGETLGKNLHQIVPDFIAECDDDGHVSFTLNDRHVPELRLNPDFKDMMAQQAKTGGKLSREQRDAVAFLKQKIDSAQGFIDAVKQRQVTLTRTMQAIIDMQTPFFREGDVSLLKPMILKDVAEKTGLDISTVSRVGNSKYVQTDYGIYPLKFFFSDGYTTQDGEELSIREIKKILKELIDAEDKKNPYTDDELRSILDKKGYPMARRTIAKYRQQMNIPVARLRK